MLRFPEANEKNRRIGDHDAVAQNSAHRYAPAFDFLALVQKQSTQISNTALLATDCVLITPLT